MPDSKLSTDPYASLPHVPDEIGITLIDGNAADMKVSLTEFLNEQRAIVASDLDQMRMNIAYAQKCAVKFEAVLAMIDNHLAELAQPVEPGQEVQS